MENTSVDSFFKEDISVSRYLDSLQIKKCCKSITCSGSFESLKCSQSLNLSEPLVKCKGITFDIPKSMFVCFVLSGWGSVTEVSK